MDGKEEGKKLDLEEGEEGMEGDRWRKALVREEEERGSGGWDVGTMRARMREEWETRMKEAREA